MTYIDEVADEIRREVPPQLIPDGDTVDLFRLYAVLALAKGEDVVLEDVHDAWSAWMSARDPNHRSLKRLHELDRDVRRSDEPYLQAIRAAARARQLGHRTS